MPKSGKELERCILAQLDEPPPEGYSSWNGRLLAQALADIPAHQVWNILRKQGIQLLRRRSWCISTDPEFAPKAAEIVALYLDPPANAVVLSVDEKPHIPALERVQGYLRLPNGKAVRGVSHEYKRHGTTTLFAALNVLTGAVHGRPQPRLHSIAAPFEGKAERVAKSESSYTAYLALYASWAARDGWKSGR